MSSSRQKSIGQWTQGIGCLILFAIFVFCLLDVSGLQDRGTMLLSVGGYLTVIFAGVILQFVGAAIPNMRFR